MLSSIVSTSCMLETSETSQLSASEKEPSGKACRAQSRSSWVSPMAVRVGAICPAVFDARFVEPLGESLFRVRLVDRTHRPWVYRQPEAIFCSSFMHSICSPRIGDFTEPQADLLQLDQILPQLGRGTAGGSAGVVQLMHQAGGERSQRHQLFAMQGEGLVILQPRCCVLCRMARRTTGQEDISCQNPSSPTPIRIASLTTSGDAIFELRPVSSGTSPKLLAGGATEGVGLRSIRFLLEGAHFALNDRPRIRKALRHRENRRNPRARARTLNPSQTSSVLFAELREDINLTQLRIDFQSIDGSRTVAVGVASCIDC